MREACAAPETLEHANHIDRALPTHSKTLVIRRGAQLVRDALDLGAAKPLRVRLESVPGPLRSFANTRGHRSLPGRAVRAPPIRN